MLEAALKILNKIEKNGFKAYIVGGFVRDYILGIESKDVDICTNATPKEIMTIFKDSALPKEEYGSVTLFYKNSRFDITTFRREIRYINNRKPVEIEYIDDLLEDLRRRDFLMNTLCLDKKKNIIDPLNGRIDIDNKTINTVGDADYKFNLSDFDKRDVDRLEKMLRVIGQPIDDEFKRLLQTSPDIYPTKQKLTDEQKQYIHSLINQPLYSPTFNRATRHNNSLANKQLGLATSKISSKKRKPIKSIDFDLSEINTEPERQYFFEHLPDVMFQLLDSINFNTEHWTVYYKYDTSWKS